MCSLLKLLNILSVAVVMMVLCFFPSGFNKELSLLAGVLYYGVTLKLIGSDRDIIFKW